MEIVSVVLLLSERDVPRVAKKKMEENGDLEMMIVPCTTTWAAQHRPTIVWEMSRRIENEDHQGSARK